MGFLLDLPMENGDLMGLFMGFIYETWGILWDFTCKTGDVGEIFAQDKWWFSMGFKQQNGWFKRI